MVDASGAERDGRSRALRARALALRSSDVGRAGGLAVAMIATNVVGLATTVAFARLLDDYGSLAALVSFVLILSVVGQALQVATARDAVLGQLGTGPALAATLRGWTRTLVLLTAAVAVASILLREPIAAAVGVEEHAWGAAIAPPAGVLWLLLALLRGALQGIGDYRTVGVSLVAEQVVRLVAGSALAAAGLGVTGAFLGTPLALIAMAVWCGAELRRRTGAAAGGGLTVLARRLRDHVAAATIPIAGLVVVALLQNVDVIAAKHRFSTDLASSYSATTVAAKALVWVAMGAGFYLVPETSRRHAEGEDTRPVLLRVLAIVVVLSLPALAIFAVAGRQLLELAFGADRLLAVDALLPLGVAFTLLALTYLAIQYLLALRRTAFLLPLGTIALAEPVLLLAVAPDTPDGFATVVLATQALATAVALALALLRRDRAGRRAEARRTPARR
jgi:O-antigen/teichoic acid export membrane protein